MALCGIRERPVGRTVGVLSTQHFAYRRPGFRKAPFGLRHWFGEFEILLGEGDFKAANPWESGKSELAGLLPAKTIRRISEALENFDFDEAKSLADGARTCHSAKQSED